MARRDDIDFTDVIIDRSEYPGNPKRKREEKKIVTGKITEKPESTGKKILSTFFQGDFRTVGSYLLYDILFPTFKDTFSDILHSTIDILVSGESRGYSRRSRGRDRDRASYSKMYRSGSSSRDEREKAETREYVREIIFEEGCDAEEVLDNMIEVIDRDGSVSVADYYELLGRPSNFIDNKRGWINLSRARVSKVRGGYIINLPRPIDLD